MDPKVKLDSEEPSGPIAVLTGSRAGIVESANPAWTEITGFPLEETLDKPISHFLEHAGIELELVDFVGQNFLEGRPSAVEFPFQTFTGRTIQVHLSVESLRDELGEINAFRATAHVRGPDHSLPTAPPCSKRPRLLPKPDANLELETLDLSSLARRVSRTWQTKNPCSVLMDFALDDDLALQSSNEHRLEALLSHLLDAAKQARESAGGCITILSGQTQQNRSHRSEAHPIAVRPEILTAGRFAFLEVHDTATHLSPQALSRIDQNTPSDCPREIALAAAAALALSLGLTLSIDSTPGCGTQALLLFPAASLPAA
ncbi:MAG: PAS domain-containing protein [Myxococcota bacterium]